MLIEKPSTTEQKQAITEMVDFIGEMTADQDNFAGYTADLAVYIWRAMPMNCSECFLDEPGWRNRRDLVEAKRVAPLPNISSPDVAQLFANLHAVVSDATLFDLSALYAASYATTSSVMLKHRTSSATGSDGLPVPTGLELAMRVSKDTAEMEPTQWQLRVPQDVRSGDTNWVSLNEFNGMYPLQPIALDGRLSAYRSGRAFETIKLGHKATERAEAIFLLEQWCIDLSAAVNRLHGTGPCYTPKVRSDGTVDFNKWCVYGSNSEVRALIAKSPLNFSIDPGRLISVTEADFRTFWLTDEVKNAWRIVVG